MARRKGKKKGMKRGHALSGPSNLGQIGRPGKGRKKGRGKRGRY